MGRAAWSPVFGRAGPRGGWWCPRPAAGQLWGVAPVGSVPVPWLSGPVSAPVAVDVALLCPPPPERCSRAGALLDVVLLGAGGGVQVRAVAFGGEGAVLGDVLVGGGPAGAVAVGWVSRAG